MENFTDLIFMVDFKEKSISKWYVCGVTEYKNKYYIVVKSNRRNKTKYTTKNISIYRFGEDIFLTRKGAEQALKDNKTKKEYEITHSCGHTTTIRLSKKEAKKRIKSLEQQPCLSCINKECIEQGWIELEIPYSEYKNKYTYRKDCILKEGSWNKERKTVKVYFKNPQREFEKRQSKN